MKRWAVVVKVKHYDDTPDEMVLTLSPALFGRPFHLVENVPRQVQSRHRFRFFADRAAWTLNHKVGPSVMWQAVVEDEGWIKRTGPRRPRG